MKNILISILVLALVVPAMGMTVEQASKSMNMRTDLAADPWMNLHDTGIGKPAHQVDGQVATLTVGSTGQMGGYALPWAQQNGWVVSGDKMVPGAGAKDRGQWDQYLSGVPMAECDTSLKTSDPMYLSMGARPIVDQSNLPLILQGLA